MLVCLLAVRIVGSVQAHPDKGGTAEAAQGIIASYEFMVVLMRYSVKPVPALRDGEGDGEVCLLG